MMAKQAIAVDLGGTTLRAARIDHYGQILDRVEVSTKAQAGPDTVINQIKDCVEKIISHAGGVGLAGIGVSCPGPLDTKRGLALSIPTLKGFDDYPLLETLQKNLPLPVKLENDAISAAIGEWRFGAGVGFENVVYVTVSTGIGGGVVVDNNVLRGRQGMACHIGHMILVPDGARCNCGAKGCFEAYGAGPAFEKRAQLKANSHNHTVLGRNQQIIDARAIFAAAATGDKLALELLAEEAHILGTGFASLAHLFSPDVIIMGGGLSNSFDLLYSKLQTRFSQLAMPAFKDIAILPATLGGNSGLIGAGSLILQQR
jgi:glucokinase